MCCDFYFYHLSGGPYLKKPKFSLSPSKCNCIFFLFKEKIEPGVVVHTCNLSTWEKRQRSRMKSSRPAWPT
jgi:hypothetical protein